MRKRISTRAVCPYYRSEERQVVFCDGITDGSVIHLAFANYTDCKNHKESMCKGDYMKCPIVRMLQDNEVM